MTGEVTTNEVAQRVEAILAEHGFESPVEGAAWPPTVAMSRLAHAVVLASEGGLANDGAEAIARVVHRRSVAGSAPEDWIPDLDRAEEEPQPLVPCERVHVPDTFRRGGHDLAACPAR